MAGCLPVIYNYVGVAWLETKTKKSTRKNQGCKKINKIRLRILFTQTLLIDYFCKIGIAQNSQKVTS